jgi:hypothetical protein
MQRHLWVEDDQAPQALVTLLERLLLDSKSWSDWCSALEVMAELSRLRLSGGFTVVLGSLPEDEGPPTPASWLEWQDFSIITTAEWMFVYPSLQWRQKSRAVVSLTLNEQEAEALIQSRREAGPN